MIQFDPLSGLACMFENVYLLISLSVVQALAHWFNLITLPICLKMGLCLNLVCCPGPCLLPLYFLTLCRFAVHVYSLPRLMSSCCGIYMLSVKLIVILNTCIFVTLLSDEVLFFADFVNSKFWSVEEIQSLLQETVIKLIKMFGKFECMSIFIQRFALFPLLLILLEGSLVLNRKSGRRCWGFFE